MDKCKNCDWFVVTKSHKNNTRGSGYCYHKPKHKVDLQYFGKYQYRYFSDPICKNFKKRTCGLQVGKGGGMKTYIHYGSYSFSYEICRQCFDNMKNGILAATLKPFGLWGSDINSEFKWEDWCRLEEFHLDNLKSSFKFTLDPSANILEIKKEDDILPYIIIDESYSRPNVFGHQLKTSISDRFNINLLAKEFDGIELYMSENYTELKYSIFNTWDCDSIVVWNPDIIKEL